MNLTPEDVEKITDIVEEAVAYGLHEAGTFPYKGNVTPEVESLLEIHSIYLRYVTAYCIKRAKTDTREFLEAGGQGS